MLARRLGWTASDPRLEDLSAWLAAPQARQSHDLVALFGLAAAEIVAAEVPLHDRDEATER